MKNASQLLLGFITAVGSTLIVLSAASLALLEGGASISAVLPPTETPSAAAAPTTALPQPLASPAPETPTAAITLSPTPTEALQCQNTPADWIPYVVQSGDTITSLVTQSGAAVDEFLKANCFVSNSMRLEPGWVVYLPPTAPTPTPTFTATPVLPTPTQCGAPAGWATYIVQAGDNLYRLGLAVNMSVYQLQMANCLPNDRIYAGQILRLPFIPARIPTGTPTATVTPVPSDTVAPPTRTFTPTVTPVTPVGKQDQTINFSAISNKAYGDPDFRVSAQATSGLPVTFTASGNCAISGDQVTITGVGSCTITASQAGNDTYNPAPNVSQSFTINKGTATVTLGALTFTYDGSPKATTATTTPAGLPVTITYAGSTTPPSAVGSYPVVATVNDANYEGSVSGTLTINKGTATVTLGALTFTYDGSPKATTATTSPAGLSVTITYAGSTTPPSAVGSYPVVATVNDPNYEGSASGTLTISDPPAPPPGN